MYGKGTYGNTKGRPPMKGGAPMKKKKKKKVKKNNEKTEPKTKRHLKETQ